MANQIKVSISPALNEQIAKRAATLGITKASYLKMLAAEDLRRSGENYPDHKNTAEGSKVIVINNERSIAGTKKTKSGRRNQKVSIDQLWRYL